MSQSSDFSVSPAAANVDLDVAMENTAPVASVPAAPGTTGVNDDADAPSLGIKDSKYAPKPDVRAMLEQARQDASALSLSYLELSRDDPTLAEKKAELEFAEERVNTLTKTLTWQTKVPTGITDARLVAQAPIFQIARLMECDSNLPVFDTIHIYIRRLEKVMETHQVDKDASWKAYLSASILDHAVDQWFCEFLHPLDINWSKARLILVDRFSDKASDMVTAKALFTMKMNANRETLAAFSLRFQSALHEANWKDSPAIAMLCLIALPKSLSNDIFVAYHSRKQDHSRPQTAQEVLSLATKIHQQKRSLDSDDEDIFHGKAKKSRTTKDTSRYKYCSEHGSRSSHTSENCRVLHPELANKSPRDSKSSPGNAVKSRSSAPTTANTTGSIRLCWYCEKAPYSKQHMCDERKKAIAAKSNVRSIKTAKHAKHPADQSIDHLHDNMQAIRLQAFDESMDTGKTPLKFNINMITDPSHRANKPYIFPLLLQNKRAYALLDTGADVSVISRSFIDVNKILIQPNSTCLNLAGKDNTLLTHGKSSPILVSFNNVTLKHQFEVIDLDDDDRIDCYIGDDLINLFNITVSNIPCHWPDQKLESTKENHNVDNPLEPNNAPAGTPEDHQEFMQAIQPYTDKNQMIPKTSFCPLDISIIRLDTPTIPTNRTNHRQYPIALTLQPLVDEAVATWKAEGTIVDAPIDTTWNSPITLAPKKDEHGNVTGHRPCLDPRHINKHLPDDVYPLPLIKDIFESMHGSTVFTTLDLKSAFHRFKIHPDDQHKTTFTHRGRQYMFQGAPFGLKPLSAKFQRVMHTIFHGLPYVNTFIDDVVVYSPDLHSHTTHVITAIQRLTDANLILNPKKCHWAQTAVYLLGFCISNHGYDLDHRKVCNVLEWSRPTSGHGVQKFLGIVNYFRAHLPNAAAMTAPLDALRNKEAITDKDWTPLHEKHFLLIKQQLQMNTILHYPDPNLPFYVATDASNYGIGAALYQIINDQERFIGYMARSLSPSERNYNTTKRELLAIVFALKKVP